MFPGVTFDEEHPPVADRGISDMRFRVRASRIVLYFTLDFPQAAVTQVRLGPKTTRAKEKR